MCGIAGFFDRSGRSDEVSLKRMGDTLVHRGPDDSGCLIRHFGDVSVGLSHRRLSILDLSPLGHQPMSYEHVDIVFNGEIYNFREIRAELERDGMVFRSGSDTEVILAGYCRWGISVVDKLIGMFAFALLDNKSSKLFLVRDRLGVKPLYFYRFGESLLFASELKAFHSHAAFHRSISRQGLLQYLQFGYTQGATAIFEDVSKVAPGSYLELDLSRRQSREVYYWRAEDSFSRKKERSDADIQEELEQLLISAVNYRMVADVPVGLFLSGGYDSSTVAALLQNNRTEKIKTFTIGFDDPALNEAPHAKAVAQHLGTDHTESYCSITEALGIVPDLPHFFDEPFADYSSIPTMLVSRSARRQVTVALSADGGDEIFGGYPKYLQALRYARWKGLPLGARGAAAKLYFSVTDGILGGFDGTRKLRSTNAKIAELIEYREALDFVRINVQQFEQKSLQRLVRMRPGESSSAFYDLESFAAHAPLDQLLILDSKVYLPDDLLVKVDRSTMSVSLEGREPLLDHRLMEFMGTVPADRKLSATGRDLKHYLKRIAHKYVPRALLDRPKMGFTPPIGQWLRGPLRERVEHYLDKAVIDRQGIFDAAEVECVRRELLEYGYGRSAKKVWNLFVFQMWFEKWVSAP